MTLRHIKIFVAVCEYNSITRAAEKLFLSQPAVSLAISEIEDYYGIKLFDRISRKLYITETGKQFLNYALHIVSLFDEMEKSIKDWDSIGLLRIGSSITIGTYLLPDYVQHFQKKYPQMKVQVVIDNSEAIEKRVLENEIDIALIEGVIHNDQIESRKFMTDKLVLVCGKNHPFYDIKNIDVLLLKDQNFILREKGSGARELFDSVMLIHGIQIKPIWESVSTPAIIKAVSAGIGLAVLPYLLVKEDLENRNIREIKIIDIDFERNYYIIFHKNKFFTNSAKAFMELCK